MAITIIPIPPSHCIIDLHNNILFGVWSKLLITVEPVVVIPDMLSKKASLKDKFIVESIKGKLPNKAIDIQANVENKNVCCKFNLNSFSRLAKINNIPIKIVINADDKKL